jgi:hypothetical protein
MLASFLQRSAHVLGQQTCRTVPLNQQQPLRRVGVRSGVTSDAVSDEEAQRFEKIAAALVEKLKDLPDTEEEPLGESYQAAGTDLALFLSRHSSLLSSLLLLP